eukprot:363142-Chlamydomonas_euryale.AAC.7
MRIQAECAPCISYSNARFDPRRNAVTCILLLRSQQQLMVRHGSHSSHSTLPIPAFKFEERGVAAAVELHESP